MIDKYRDKLDEKGVSPVIGVILLVAVTVALVALAHGHCIRYWFWCFGYS